jgi:hypothetical protein
MNELATAPALENTEFLPAVKRLDKDLRKASRTLDRAEARYMVKTYYQIQEIRKASDNQQKALEKSGKPHETLAWLFAQQETLELQIKAALMAWTDSNPISAWAKSIVGIGPVIAAGLAAHIDINKAQTAGHIWRFAGLVEGQQWLGKAKADAVVSKLLTDGQTLPQIIETVSQQMGCRAETLLKWATTGKDGKVHKLTQESVRRACARRPWNDGLRTLCWKIGESFMKVSNRDGDFYGQIYKQRKALEIARNDSGQLSDQAVKKLDKFNIGKTTDAWPWYAGCYPAGTTAMWSALIDEDERRKFLDSVRRKAGEGQKMLSPGHIQSRAKRYAVKFFLSHYQHVAFVMEFGKMPPKPFVIEHLGHVDLINPPNFDATQWLKPQAI